VSEATAATDLSLPLLSPAAMSVVIVKQHTSQLPLRSSEVTAIEEDIPEKYARDMDLLVATGAKLAVPKHMKKQTFVAEQKITVTSVARIDRNTASSPRKSIFCDIGSSLYSPQPPSSTKGRSSLIRHSRVVGGTLMPVDDFDTSGVSTQLQQTDPEQSGIFGRNKYDDSARLLKKSSGSSTRKSIKKSLNDFKQLGEDNDLAHFKELALQLQFPSDVQSNLRSF
jgi:hypothetical protein